MANRGFLMALVLSGVAACQPEGSPEIAFPPSSVTQVVLLGTGTPNAERAEKAGFEVLSAAQATGRADVVMMLVPDQTQAVVYRNDVAPNLKDGDTLMFAHGFNVSFGRITPPEGVDCIMIAPKGPGHLVRRTYVEGGGVPALIPVGMPRIKVRRQVDVVGDAFIRSDIGQFPDQFHRRRVAEADLDHRQRAAQVERAREATTVRARAAAAQQQSQG